MTLVKWNRGSNGSNQSPSNQSNMPYIKTQLNSLWPDLFDPFTRPLFTNNLVQDFFDETLNMGTGSIGTTLPAVNISETNNELNIEVAAPGMNKNNFKVEVKDDQLNISYHHETKAEEGNKTTEHWRREYRFESFSRSFSLPPIVESEKIAASYVDGILKITVPKKEEARKKPAQNITIK